MSASLSCEKKGCGDIAKTAGLAGCMYRWQRKRRRIAGQTQTISMTKRNLRLLRYTRHDGGQHSAQVERVWPATLFFMVP
jgi:hypothetical protein